MGLCPAPANPSTRSGIVAAALSFADYFQDFYGVYLYLRMPAIYLPLALHLRNNE